MRDEEQTSYATSASRDGGAAVIVSFIRCHMKQKSPLASNLTPVTVHTPWRFCNAVRERPGSSSLAND